MGEPVPIRVLAEQMIRLAGKQPYKDIPIIYTGLRPGEKLHETLFYSDEDYRSTAHPKILEAGVRSHVTWCWAMFRACAMPWLVTTPPASRRSCSRQCRSSRQSNRMLTFHPLKVVPFPAREAQAPMSKRIRKAVFPVAGLGTRFLPATKTVPKEMLPIIDRPLIQYAVDEAIEAGCDTLVFITNRYKHAVADYFDKAYELEQKLERAGKQEQLEMIRHVLPNGVRAIFVTQAEALGLGHAVLCAKAVIGDEPFAAAGRPDLEPRRRR